MRITDVLFHLKRSAGHQDIVNESIIKWQMLMEQRKPPVLGCQ